MHAERLKQQGRLFPLFIFEMLTSTRRLRVSGLFVALTQRTHSHRAIGVVSFHTSWICCGAAARAAARSWGHVRLWPVLGHLDVERRILTRADASSVLQRVIDPHPVARISVWFEHGLELDAIDRSVDGHLPARGQVLARRLRQPQHSRCVDCGQRGVEANGRSLSALSHRRPSSLPFRIWHPDGDTVIECVTVHSTARVPWRGPETSAVASTSGSSSNTSSRSAEYRAGADQI